MGLKLPHRSYQLGCDTSEARDTVAKFCSDLAACSVVGAVGRLLQHGEGRQRGRGQPELGPALEAVSVLPGSAAWASTGPGLWGSSRCLWQRGGTTGSRFCLLPLAMPSPSAATRGGSPSKLTRCEPTSVAKVKGGEKTTPEQTQTKLLICLFGGIAGFYPASLS